MSTTTYEELLQCPSLPTLPTVAVEILELTRDPNVKLKDIEKLVQTDQGLSTRVLRTVNSSLYSLRQPCSTINRSLAYLGLNAVKSLVLGFSLVDVSKGIGEDVDFDMSEYWRRVIYSSAGARHMAVAIRKCDPDEAFTCGIFQDIGMLAAIIGMGHDYVPALVQANNRHDKLPAIEKELFDYDHAEVGAGLAERWKMPDGIVTCVKYHHNPDAAPKEHRELVRAVYLGRLIAEALIDPTQARMIREAQSLVSTWYGKLSQSMDEIVQQTATSASDFAQVLDKKIGSSPEVSELMLQAQQAQIEQQIMAHRQVDELRQTNDDLEQAIVTDGLTRVGNRKFFDRELEQLFIDARDNGRKVGLLFSDADRFKSVNDTHGHQAGDAVLVELAQRLDTVIGDNGLVCRYGGEEFAVILPDHDVEAAAAQAEKIRAAIEAVPFDLRHVDCEPDELKVTVSIGVSALDADAGLMVDAPENLTAQADEAVYAAKEGGRNCVRISGREAPPAATSADPPKDTIGTVKPAAAPVTSSAPPPAQAEVPAAPVQPVRAAKASHDGRRTILLVEDDALAATLISAMFERVPNTTVIWVTGVDEARTVLSECVARTRPVPDIVVTDYQLRSQRATEVVEILRRSQLFRHVPAVIITATTDPVEFEACMNAGADEVYSKQNITQDLQGWMRELLAKYMTSERAA
ncbi:MAG: HDOD domain-containing protein [Planctomycetota bacterium]